MPKTVRICINLVCSLILFILLISKAARTFPNLGSLAELWDLSAPRELFRTTSEHESWVKVLFFVFGIYPAILLTAAAVWTRGVLPIIFSAIGGIIAFVLYFFEMIFVSVNKAFEVDTYMGFDPLISVWTYLVAFIILAVSVAELIINKKKRSY